MTVNIPFPTAKIPPVISADDLFFLFPGEMNTWFFVPRALRMSMSNNDGRSMFKLIRQRIHTINGTKVETVGGIFGAQLDFAVVVTAELVQKWTDQITHLTSIAPHGQSTFDFRPLTMSGGLLFID